MARSNRLYKNTYNQALEVIRTDFFPISISALATVLGVSRTTSRKVVDNLAQQKLVAILAGKLVVLKQPTQRDFFPVDQTISTEQAIEVQFREWLIRERIVGGAKFSEAQLVRQFGVSVSTVREHLIRLSRFGFIRKEPQRHWVLEGFSEEYAQDVFEIRRLFELRNIRKLAMLDRNDPFWSELEEIKQVHQALLANVDVRYMEVPKLDAEFHSLLTRACKNQFLMAMQDVISLIFHYHYHHVWDEKIRHGRGASALMDHLEIIDALVLGDPKTAENAMEKHLEHSKKAWTKNQMP